VMFGAFTIFFFFSQAGLPVLVAVLLAMVVLFLLAFFGIERLFIRPLIGQPLLAMVMMTVAIAAVFRGITQIIWGSDLRSYPQYLPQEPLQVGNIIIAQEYFWGCVIALVLLAILIIYFRFAKSGMAMRAIADDQQAAQSMGVTIGRIFGITWGIAFLVAAAGGLLFGSIFSVGFHISECGLKVFPVVILGGLDSIGGAVIGGLIVGLLEGLAGSYLSEFLPGVKDIFPYFILLIVLLFKPYGLFGLKRIERI